MREVGCEYCDVPDANIDCIQQRWPVVYSPVVNSQEALQRVEYILYWAIDGIVRGPKRNSMACLDDQGRHVNIMVGAFGTF